MAKQLYPLGTVRVHHSSPNEANAISELWANNISELPSENYFYGVYHEYSSGSQRECRFSIAVELPIENHLSPIQIEDNALWYEIFPTKREYLTATWQYIYNREKQGLLKRAYSVDFEKYYPDGKIEIYIAISPHC